MSHVKNSSGNFEWYTLEYIISLAKSVMGEIDLDPASCESANSIVKAEEFFGIGDNSLDRDWGGRVYINPPHRQPHILRFANKLLYEIDVGRVTQAIWLSNNATETKWCQPIISYSRAICFPRRRIKFLDHNLRPKNSPTQGQIIVALGKKVDCQKFYDEFSNMGQVIRRERG